MSKSLILASASPRRRELVSYFGIPFEVISPDVDESSSSGESGIQLVRRLSKLKANAVRSMGSRSESNIILAADTTVISPTGKILEKPADFDQAVRMIQALQGKTHRVATGFTLIRSRPSLKFEVVTKVVQTAVRFRPLSRDECRAYVQAGESMDKAGAYAAQGRGSALIHSVRGSYTNVIGLPVAEVWEILRKWIR